MFFILHCVMGSDDEESKNLSTDEQNAKEVQNFRIKFDNFTIFTFVLIAISLIVASASGIGGGGILVSLRKYMD